MPQFDFESCSNILSLLQRLQGGCEETNYYLILSKSVQSTAGLKALKLAANGRYLMCKSLLNYINVHNIVNTWGGGVAQLVGGRTQDPKT